jgi:hypothetical protein
VTGKLYDLVRGIQELSLPDVEARDLLLKKIQPLERF